MQTQYAILSIWRNHTEQPCQEEYQCGLLNIHCLDMYIHICYIAHVYVLLMLNYEQYNYPEYTFLWI